MISRATKNKFHAFWISFRHGLPADEVLACVEKHGPLVTKAAARLTKWPKASSGKASVKVGAAAEVFSPHGATPGENGFEGAVVEKHKNITALEEFEQDCKEGSARLKKRLDAAEKEARQIRKEIAKS